MSPRRDPPVQLLGIILIAGGLVMILAGSFTETDPLLFIGGVLAILGLPLLLPVYTVWLGFKRWRCP